MKKTLNLLILGLFTLGMMVASCAGPEGPQGPAGADGTDGTDGVDANSFCINCHTMGVKADINAQFAMSSHMQGNYAGYAGGRSGCAMCHSHQGAMETNMTGRDTTAANIPIPTGFKCETCHDFHATLDSTEFPDYALRNKESILALFDGRTTPIDLPGNGNSCANCHQTRRTTEPYNSENDVFISSTHWGGHHGPQANVIAGVGIFEPAGSMTIDANSAHATGLGCTDCHMAKNPDNMNVGGHTWMMTDSEGNENMAACTTCHTDATSFDVNNLQSDIHHMLEEIATILTDMNLLDDEGHPVPGTYPANQAGAVFNYILFEEDRSLGVHNPKYVEAVVTNTLEMVQGW